MSAADCPEELRHVDQDLVEEDREFLDMHLEVVPVFRKVPDAELRTTMGDPAQKARALVAREVESSRVAEELDEALEILAGFERHV